MPQTQTRSAISTIGPVVNVILEQALRAVVGESLCQFDDGDQVGRSRKVLAHSAESTLLVLVGLFAFGRRVELDISRCGGGFLFVQV